MSEEGLVGAIQRLLGWHGALSVETATDKLIEEGWFGEDFRANAFRRAAISAVRRAFQAADVTHRPLFRMRRSEDDNAPPLHVQLSFADEHDWMFTLDEKAKGIRGDTEAYERELDVFEDLFGYRYQSPMLPESARMAGVSYPEEPLTD